MNEMIATLASKNARILADMAMAGVPAFTVPSIDLRPVLAVLRTLFVQILAFRRRIA